METVNHDFRHRQMVGIMGRGFYFQADECDERAPRVKPIWSCRY